MIFTYVLTLTLINMNGVAVTTHEVADKQACHSIGLEWEKKSAGSAADRGSFYTCNPNISPRRSNGKVK